jgi:Family of unknown function (DUF5682)
LSELVEALELCDRLARGHIPGLGLDRDRIQPVLATPVEAAVAAVEALAGSDRLEDTRALLAVSQRVPPETMRLRAALETLERSGSPLMQGAAGAVRVLVGQQEPDTFGTRLASWLDGSDQPSLARRLTGALTLAAPLFEAAPGIAGPLIERVTALEDTAFLRRLPALREGFEALAPAARQRFLEALKPTLAPGFDLRLETSATTLARWAAADLRGREALLALLPEALADAP